MILLKSIFKGIAITAVFAAIYFGLNWAVSQTENRDWINFVNLSTIITLPACYGVLIAKITPNPRRLLLGYLLWPPILAAGALLLSFVSGLEGLICVWMAFVPFVGASMLGGLIYYIYQTWITEHDSNRHNICFILPFVAIYAESQLPVVHNPHLVQTKIQISAPVDVVFQSLKSIQDIDPSEVETNLTHHLNIPKPTSATWHGTHRVSQWGPDVRFIEHITSISENKYINWKFEFPEGWIKDGIEDHHIRIGGRFFSIDEGGYELRDLGNATELTLWTKTTDHTRLGAYAAYWNDFFIGNFHDAILGVVKSRNEARY